MAKARTQFVCQNCGTVHSRWVGKCDGCGEWNTIIEDNPTAGIGGGPMRTPKKGRPVALTTLSGEIEDAPRIQTGISELDRVTGGGFVRGSALLVGGDPGIGKSTVLMQAAAALARRKHRVIYVSGEEAIAQVRLRAQRLGAADSDVLLAAETNVEDILATLSEGKRPDLVIIDSIQTLWSDIVDSAPGTVTQVRTGVQAMIRFAKQTGTAVVLVGHVTKEGQIAGPRVVEHMVDAVLYFEGDRGHHYRILRTVKNRFGPTDEIGVFEMSDKGLREVANPSELFLGERNAKSPGAAVFAGMEGTRPRACRGTGAGRADIARNAAPRRGRLGLGPPFDDPRRAGSPLRHSPRPARRLPQCRGWLSHFRTGGRSRCGFRTGFVACRACPAARLRLFRRSQLVGCSPAGCAYRPTSQGSRETRFLPGSPAICIDRVAEERQRPLERDGKPAGSGGAYRGIAACPATDE